MAEEEIKKEIKKLNNWWGHLAGDYSDWVEDKIGKVEFSDRIKKILEKTSECIIKLAEEFDINIPYLPKRQNIKK